MAVCSDSHTNTLCGRNTRLAVHTVTKHCTRCSPGTHSVSQSSCNVKEPYTAVSGAVSGSAWCELALQDPAWPFGGWGCLYQLKHCTLCKK